jgi:20S proteasome alpha/beta subunit
MISPLLKPRLVFPHPFHDPKSKRLQKRKINMTLVGAFRSKDGGVLLCADREENDGYGSKSEVNKICHVKMETCSLFIAGAGLTSTIKNAETKIHGDFMEAFSAGMDVVSHHQALIESSLKSIYKSYSETLIDYPMDLIIVFVIHSLGTVPIVYRSERAILVPEPIYVAAGSGKMICDYFSGRLYEYPGMSQQQLIALAAFIFREANKSASGVGSEVDMNFIWGFDKGRLELRPELIKEIQDGIPSLLDSLRDHWWNHAKIPDWLKNSKLFT